MCARAESDSDVTVVFRRGALVRSRHSPLRRRETLSPSSPRGVAGTSPPRLSDHLLVLACGDPGTRSLLPLAVEKKTRRLHCDGHLARVLPGFS